MTPNSFIIGQLRGLSKILHPHRQIHVDPDHNKAVTEDKPITVSAINKEVKLHIPFICPSFEGKKSSWMSQQGCKQEHGRLADVQMSFCLLDSQRFPKRKKKTPHCWLRWQGCCIIRNAINNDESRLFSCFVYHLFDYVCLNRTRLITTSCHSFQSNSA